MEVQHRGKTKKTSSIVVWVLALALATLIVPFFLWRQLPRHGLSGDASLRGVSVGREKYASGSNLRIGMSKLPWIGLGLALEMVPHASRADVDAMAAVKRALKKYQPPQSVIDNSTELSQLTSLETHEHKGRHHAHETMTAWSLHEETDPVDLGVSYELVVPWLDSEGSGEFVVAASDALTADFEGGKFAAMHLTIDGRCLLADNGNGLVALLLLWEHFHTTIAKLVARRPGAAQFRRTLAEMNPELLKALQGRWSASHLDNPEDNPEDHEEIQTHLDVLFTRHAGDVRGEKGTNHGYSTLAINVCHLLNVKCCDDCPKNKAPKLGGINFRLFDAVFGQRLRLVMALAERLVQAICAQPSAKELTPLLALQGVTPATDLVPLFTFLNLDPVDFRNAFETSKPAPANINNIYR